MSRTIRLMTLTLNETYIGLSATVEEYHRMAEQVTNHVRCELLRGRIVKRTVATPAHRNAMRQLTECLRPFVTAEFVLDSQGPITLTDSEPEPDLCITIGPDSRYKTRHAGASEVVLLVEISDSSLATDRGQKLQIYAEAKIPVYWIVNLQERIVEVYTLPRGGRNPTYRSRVDFAAGMAVPVIVAGKPLGTIPTSQILQ